MTTATSSGGVWSNMALWKKIFIGMVAGILVGAVVGPDVFPRVQSPYIVTIVRAVRTVPVEKCQVLSCLVGERSSRLP